MEGFKGFNWSFIAISSLTLMMCVMPVFSQFNTACASSMITTFTPCLSYITGSTANGASPTADCCRSLKALVTNGMSCACLVVTGNVPLNLPVNQSLAISLPSACNMPSIPMQCQAAGAPLPAPGPVALGPTLSPSTDLSPSPTASVIPESTSGEAPALSPQPETSTGLSPASSPVSTKSPTNPGIKPVVTSSDANLSHSSSSTLLLFVVGAMILKVPLN